MIIDSAFLNRLVGLLNSYNRNLELVRYKTLSLRRSEPLMVICGPPPRRVTVL